MDTSWFFCLIVVDVVVVKDRGRGQTDRVTTLADPNPNSLLICRTKPLTVTRIFDQNDF